MKNYMKIFFLILLIPSLSYATFNNNKVSLKRALCESNSKSWCSNHPRKCKMSPKLWCEKKYPVAAP